MNSFLAIYSQIAPKMSLMRWYQNLRTKTHKKMDYKAKPTSKCSQKWMNLPSLNENMTNEWI
jgi:hypothetical protein